jgi:hypothetical protein
MLAVHVPVMAVGGKAARIMVIVREREPAMGWVDGMEIMTPATSHHAIDTGDELS